MENIDLTILEKEPKLDTRAKVIIEPLAPLSMVSDLPGSFYKSLRSPNKKMLCGLFENLLGWHIDIADRTAIQKDMIKHRKKQKIDYSKPQNGSTYIPLLYEYFDIEMVTIPPAIYYIDLWSRAFSRRSDSHKHASGSRYANADFLSTWRNITEKIDKNKKRSSTQKNTLLDNLFKRYKTHFPLYYSTPTQREFFHFKDSIQVIINIDFSALKLVTRVLEKNNLSFLGNSEGWVNINIEQK
ncbi:type I-PGING CRISPR-associated protein Cas5p [Marinilabilia salmonicolor]|uniref:CRISPR-associated protein Cas5 n=1 Tax=Marinilabilia salmonicolor TaxID=989 RepID=A0A368UV62_9BACT|nr:type I-PGING CRISPR-associated protein Cas5p [Marinilabilia salmonicolor]RCW32767.1 CRISPR-associated protein Cas5 [Marinilabilia salmonicolor]